MATKPVNATGITLYSDSTHRVVITGSRSPFSLSFQYTDGKGFWYCNCFGGFRKVRAPLADVVASVKAQGYEHFAPIEVSPVTESVGVA